MAGSSSSSGGGGSAMMAAVAQSALAKLRTELSSLAYSNATASAMADRALKAVKLAVATLPPSQSSGGGGGSGGLGVLDRIHDSLRVTQRSFEIYLLSVSDSASAVAAADTKSGDVKMSTTSAEEEAAAAAGAAHDAEMAKNEARGMISDLVAELTDMMQVFSIAASAPAPPIAPPPSAPVAPSAPPSSMQMRQHQHQQRPYPPPLQQQLAPPPFMYAGAGAGAGGGVSPYPPPIQFPFAAAAAGGAPPFPLTNAMISGFAAAGGAAGAAGAGGGGGSYSGQSSRRAGGLVASPPSYAPSASAVDRRERRIMRDEPKPPSYNASRGGINKGGAGGRGGGGGLLLESHRHLSSASILGRSSSLRNKKVESAAWGVEESRRRSSPQPQPQLQLEKMVAEREQRSLSLSEEADELVVTAASTQPTRETLASPPQKSMSYAAEQMKKGSSVSVNRRGRGISIGGGETLPPQSPPKPAAAAKELKKMKPSKSMNDDDDADGGDGGDDSSSEADEDSDGSGSASADEDDMSLVEPATAAVDDDRVIVYQQTARQSDGSASNKKRKRGETDKDGEHEEAKESLITLDQAEAPPTKRLAVASTAPAVAGGVSQKKKSVARKAPAKAAAAAQKPKPKPSAPAPASKRAKKEESQSTPFASAASLADVMIPEAATAPSELAEDEPSVSAPAPPLPPSQPPGSTTPTTAMSAGFALAALLSKQSNKSVVADSISAVPPPPAPAPSVPSPAPAPAPPPATSAVSAILGSVRSLFSSSRPSGAVAAGATAPSPPLLAKPIVPPSDNGSTAAAVDTTNAPSVGGGGGAPTLGQRGGTASPNRPRPLRILTLDGGGVRGQIEVAILVAIDTEIKRQLNLRRGSTSTTPSKTAESPLSHLSHYFDYIYGTSTGGILAATLRTEMPLDHVATLYSELPAKVFTRSSSWNRATLGAWYDPQPLERLLNEYLTDNNTRTMRTFKCRPFAVLAVDQTASERPVVLRNFGAPQQDVKWLTALRATSAAPTYFPSIEFPVGRVLVDGGMGWNNPSRAVRHQFTRELNRPADQQTVVWISLGTGVNSKIEEGWFREAALLSFLTQVVTGSEAIHVEIKHSLTVMGHSYYRFNPSISLKDGVLNPLIGDVDLAETKHSVLELMRRRTDQWLKLPGVRKDLEAAVTALLDATDEAGGAALHATH